MSNMIPLDMIFSGMARKLLPILLIPAFFLAGLYAGPGLIGAYHAVFPPRQFTTGDHAALYAKAGKPVVMYATIACPYCAKARSLFAEQGVEYTEYQIDKSEAANAEFLAKGGIGVPLLYIGERRIDGFREGAIREALASLRK
jgi:mycoredoxin